MTDEKEDILSRVEILVEDIKTGRIAEEQIVAELKEIKFLIDKYLN